MMTDKAENGSVCNFIEGHTCIQYHCASSPLFVNLISDHVMSHHHETPPEIGAWGLKKICIIGHILCFLVHLEICRIELLGVTLSKLRDCWHSNTIQTYVWGQSHFLSEFTGQFAAKIGWNDLKVWSGDIFMPLNTQNLKNLDDFNALEWTTDIAGMLSVP